MLNRINTSRWWRSCRCRPFRFPCRWGSPCRWLRGCRFSCSNTLKQVLWPSWCPPVSQHACQHKWNYAHCTWELSCNRSRSGTEWQESWALGSRTIWSRSTPLHLKIITALFTPTRTLLSHAQRLRRKTRFPDPTILQSHRPLRPKSWVRTYTGNAVCQSVLWEWLSMKQTSGHFCRSCPRPWWASPEMQSGNGTRRTGWCPSLRHRVLSRRKLFGSSCSRNRFRRWTSRK